MAPAPVAPATPDQRRPRAGPAVTLSPSSPQDDPIAYWNGLAGSRWVDEQVQLDRMLEPFAVALLEGARPRPGERVLDVGCGCGATTLALGQAVRPGGQVLGVDVSEPMLARARERAAGDEGVAFMQADATRVTVEPADLITSRFGVMFFEDPVAAFTNLGRLLRPGGRLVFVCWRPLDENPWASRPFAAVLDLIVRQVAAGVAIPLPVGLDAAGPGPFSLASPERVRSLLAGAGLDQVVLEPLDLPVWLGDSLPGAVELAASGGPAARLLREVDEGTRELARGVLTEVLRPHQVEDGSVIMSSACWRVSARRPG